MPKYIAELIGTFFLVLVIGLTGSPLAIGATLMTMIYAFGHVSGAHYNPAVTLAVMMRQKISGKDAAMYMIFQVAGALLAALTTNALIGHTFAPQPGSDAGILTPLLVEALFTFALASVVLNVAVAKAATGNSYYGLAIGFTVFAAATAGGAISGGAFNPAVGLGPCLVDSLIGGTSAVSNVWIYLVGPFAGGALAAALFGYMHPGE